MVALQILDWVLKYNPRAIFIFENVDFSVGAQKRGGTWAVPRFPGVLIMRDGS